MFQGSRRPTDVNSREHARLRVTNLRPPTNGKRSYNGSDGPQTGNSVQEAKEIYMKKVDGFARSRVVEKFKSLVSTLVKEREVCIYQANTEH